MIAGKSRETARAQFLALRGWGTAEVTPLAADASFRRYFRVRRDRGRAVLMDAPPDKEPVKPFCAVAGRLRELGFSAPRVLARDDTNGFLLLEDFGDSTFTRLLAGGHDETALYDLAVDVLTALHRIPDAQVIADHSLPPYDMPRFLAEADLLPDWYAPAMKIGLPRQTRVLYDHAWIKVLEPLVDGPRTLVLRDFHIDNLMLLPGRTGAAACGLLDFQDAVAGPALYDLVSLLEDARRDIADDLIARGRDRYLAAFPQADRKAFDTAWAVLAAQRHAKVIGIFVRLCVRDGKSQYLTHIPRVWRLLARALKHPALAPVAGWFEENLPPDEWGIPPCA